MPDETTPVVADAPATIDTDDNRNCADCGGTITDDEKLTDSVGQPMCEQCHTERYAFCDDCETDKPRESSTTVGRITVCQDCFDEDYFTCFGCDDGTNNQDGYEGADGHTYCQYCFDDRFGSCYDCSRTFWTEDMEIVDGEPYCSSCRPSDDIDECEPDTFRYFQFSGFDATAAAQFPIAFEIEAEDGDRSDVANALAAHSKGIGVSDDSSLTDGVEVQIPPSIGSTRTQLVNHVASGLSHCGFYARKSCGLHLHVGVGDLSTEQVKKIVATFYAFEPLLFAMQPPSRRGNRYCKSLDSVPFGHAVTLQDFLSLDAERLDLLLYNSGQPLPCDDAERENKLKTIARYKREKYGGERYYSLNVHSFFYRKTFEIRLHAGTLNPTKILNFAAIVDRLFGFALKHGGDADTLGRIRGLASSVLAPHHETVDQTRDTAAILSLCETLNLPNEISTYVAARVGKFATVSRNPTDCGIENCPRHTSVTRAVPPVK